MTSLKLFQELVLAFFTNCVSIQWDHLSILTYPACGTIECTLPGPT